MDYRLDQIRFYFLFNVNRIKHSERKKLMLYIKLNQIRLIFIDLLFNGDWISNLNNKKKIKKLKNLDWFLLIYILLLYIILIY